MGKIGLKYCNWLFVLFPLFVSGQWENGQVSVSFSLPEVALVDVEPDDDNSIQFTILPGTESGEKPEVGNASNNSLWLNYSSALPANLSSRSITAEVSQGVVPPGIQLFLEASHFQGNGRGIRGQSSGKIELTGSPRPVISGIGNCYTGDGINSGHQLTFSIAIDDAAEMGSAGEHNFVILYTLTDN